MKKKIFFCILFLVILSGNKKIEIKEGKIYTKQVMRKNMKKIIGRPYNAKVDEKLEDILAFIKKKDENIGLVVNYKRQFVNGFNHYFEFEHINEERLEKRRLEVVVYEGFNKDLKIVSKNYL